MAWVDGPVSSGTDTNQLAVFARGGALSAPCSAGGKLWSELASPTCTGPPLHLGAERSVPPHRRTATPWDKCYLAGAIVKGPLTTRTADAARRVQGAIALRPSRSVTTID